MSIEVHKRLAKLFPDHLHELWGEWELRGLILLSLVSQIILTSLGNRSKYKPNSLTQPLLWSAYMLANWVAAVAMGVISSNLGDYYNKGEQKRNFNPQLLAFWAPFFLMHLGSPDTITAHALEDNELWLRHLVGWLSQTTLTTYVIIMSWRSNWLSHLTIPMLIIGIIKYGEKTWSLYCGSIKHLRDSFLRSIDSSKRSEQRQEYSRMSFLHIRSLGDFMKALSDLIWDCFRTRQRRVGNPKTFLSSIYIFVSLFVDLVLGSWDITHDRREFLAEGHSNWMLSFSLVDYELNLMYDVFYTKSFANYGIFGLMSRFATLTTTLVVFVSYASLSQKKEYSLADHIITYLLLVGALIAEIYAFVLVASSKWTRHYFIVKGLSTFCLLQECIDWLRFIGKGGVQISLGQSNFFNLICNKKLKIKGKYFPVNKLEELSSVSHCLTSNDLQRKIFQHLYMKSEEGVESNPSGAPRYRNLLLEQNYQIFSVELEFHRTIITWHIATELFYYSDESPINVDVVNSRKNCKEMSDYMFYLLVKERHMLPVGAGLITLRDTIIEAMKVVPQQDNVIEACSILLQHDTATTRDDEASNMQSTPVLFHACAVAEQLIVANYKYPAWQFVEELWVEILSYAGAQCRVDMHAHQLTKGSEFLSHVWLIQAHLGLLDQFQITPRQQVCKC